MPRNFKAFFWYGAVIISLAIGDVARAIPIGHGGVGSAMSGGSTSATASATAGTALPSQIAAISLPRQQQALQSMQALQAQARAAAAAANSTPNGLVIGWLVPGVAGTDPADPTTTAIAVPVTAGASGSASVNLKTNSALTLPTTITSSTQVTVSGAANTTWTVTNGSTITALTPGVATSVAPGSTISVAGPTGSAGTVTFAGGSGVAIPSSFATYTLPAPTSWTGVSGLTQASYGANGQTAVTITQSQQQALLNWQTFNVGSNTLLDFDQSAGGSNVSNWVALNQVAPNIAPSQILGSIQAPGQVYVINQNGIIFGGGSQINTHSFTASSLPMNSNLIADGLLNNPDYQFLFSQLNIPVGSINGTPAYTPPSAPTGGMVAHANADGTVNLMPASGQDGDVVAQAGSQLSSPTTAEHVGGRVALVGPNVVNNGTITTPDGQTILAAGLQVGLAAHASSDPSLRGLDVSVGQVSDPSYAGGASNVAGTVANFGLVEAPRANVTLAGSTVNQNGVIDSSTSVTLNGSIDLLANYGAEPFILQVNGFEGVTGLYSTQSGKVVFGANSVTDILPEISSAETQVGTMPALPSQINAQGQSIYMGTNSEILAPSATVDLNAGTWALDAATYQFVNTIGQVYLDSGAIVDVSGEENVNASVTENIISAQLLGTELANSPVQQNGPLRGATVQVNVLETGNYDGTEWVGSPIGDLSGYVNLIERNVGEMTDSGGTVNMTAGQSVVMQPGSLVNVSGGWINYQGADVQTTKVVYNGQVMDISQATPNLNYSGIFTGYTAASSKWGVVQTYNSPLVNTTTYQPGYLQGGSGGSLTITAPSMALDGAQNSAGGGLFGYKVTGANQTVSASAVVKTFGNGATSVEPTMMGILGVPNASHLNLVFTEQTESGANIYTVYSPTPPVVTFQGGVTGQQLVGAFNSDPSSWSLSADREANVYLSPDLVNTDGFGNFSITNDDGLIVLPEDVSLTAPLAGSITTNSSDVMTAVSGGSITFDAANIDIEGSITAPGGNLTLAATDISPYTIFGEGVSVPNYDDTRGNIQLGPQAVLNTAGLIINDGSNATASQANLPLLVDGGSVSIRGSNVVLAAGSALNVSGGVYVNSSNKKTYGNGGSIALAAGQDLDYGAVLGGTLTVNAALQGYSGASGGSLSVLAPLIQVGGTPFDAANTLLLAPNFFNQGGFSSFTLEGLGEASSSFAGGYAPAVEIAPGTQIVPVAESYQASLNGSLLVLTPTTLPLASERSPVSLAFETPGVIITGPFTGVGELVTRGDFVMGTGAAITTDPQTNSANGVTITGQTAAVFGSITVPGGAISVSGAGSYASLSAPNEALPTVDLGPDSLLSTAGVVDYTANAYGYLTGSVLAGGSINVSGNIVAEQGAVLNASGASAMLDLPSSYSSSSPIVLGFPVATKVASKGGSITLVGKQELFTDATLLAKAGGLAVNGGSLSISSGIYIAANSPAASPVQPSLIVSQNGTAFYTTGQTAIGNPVVDGQSNVIPGMGYFGATSFDNASSGFDSLTLGGSVQFQGSVTVNANRSLTVGTNGFVSIDPTIANSVVTLNGAYVDLGQAFQGPLTASELTNPGFGFVNGSAYYQPPTSGTGTLRVNATDLVDVGNLDLQNMGTVNVNVGRGDLRGDGIWDVAGNLTVTAGQIYPTTGTVFTIADYDHNGTPGSVNIMTSGLAQLPELPFSAGGTLNIYASDITQDGVLRAPIGTINLGSGVTGASPADVISGENVDSTQTLILGPDSVTSVSAVEPDGQALVLPYGTSSDGVTWTAPDGTTDITLGGVPGKTINISAANVNDESGSTLDVTGGGDLFAYRFVSGTGGTVDVLNTTSSFAVIPGYSSNFAPIDPTYGSSQGNSSTLHVGDQIYLNGSAGLPAGIYTLLPARYALMAGAFLVTPSSGTPGATVAEPNGTSLVAGYRFNSLAPLAATPLYSVFNVEPPSTVKASAEYDTYDANTFLSASAINGNVAVPRLPVDAGQVVFAADNTMIINGQLNSAAGTGGLGSEVDISSPSNIYIGVLNPDGSVPGSVPNGDLFLDSTALTDFGADSLLIGGYRTQTASGTQVNVATSNLVVNNAGAPLAGPGVILVSNADLTVDAGAEIEQEGTLSGPAATLLLGNASNSGSGDGALIRVSSDPNAKVVRSGVASQQTQSGLPTSQQATLTIGSGTTISGNGVVLDSTYATSLASNADLNGESVSLNSGEIGLEVSPQQNPPSTTGLLLSSAVLQELQSSIQNLSLLSYNAIDIYGSGDIGAPAVNGLFPVQSLALHADAIRGDGGTVVINAENISLDNSAGGTESGSGPTTSAGGSITFNADTVSLGAAGQTGANGMSVEGYYGSGADAGVFFNAFGSVSLQGAGLTTGNGTATKGAFSFTAGTTPNPANLVITTPLITGATGANASLTATGNLTIASPPANMAVAAGSSGLGATLNLAGQGIDISSDIVLHSGSLSATASAGNVSLDQGGILDVSGTAQTDFDLTQYTSGGQITLTSNTGSVTTAAGSELNVAAQPQAGNAGTLTISAPQGSFTFVTGTTFATQTNFEGQASSGQSGTFSVDEKTIAGGDVQTLNTALNDGAFVRSITIRDRTDANLALDGTVQAGTYNLSADEGSITINGTINASDVASTDPNGNPIEIGGTIDLEAGQSVILGSNSLLTVEGQTFNNAGEGGSITLDAGNQLTGAGDNPSTSGYVNIQGGTINLSVDAVDNAANVASATTAAQALGDLTGTLHIRAPQILDNSGNPTGIQVDPILGTIANASSITVEGYKVYVPTSGSIDSTESAINTNDGLFATAMGTTTAAAVTTSTTAAFTVFNGATLTGPTPAINFAPGAEIVDPSGNLTLAANWNLSTFRAGVNNFNTAVAGDLVLRASGNVVFTSTANGSTGKSASLSDGFTPGSNDNSGGLWQATMLAAGSQSWSYNIVAGADFSGANVDDVQSLSSLGASSGSLLLGQGSKALPTTTTTLASSVVPQYFETIRTGTGNIVIATGRDVQLLDPLATIYTAGTQAPSLANFDTPVLGYPLSSNFGARVVSSAAPAVQYSMEGGNVTINAQNDIADYLISTSNVVSADSSRELPTSWLYRRGFELNGQFAASHSGGDVESTSWWVNFDNFFEGIGALGGGNVALNAGRNINNVDAAVPTNARMPKVTPTASALVELGGGDLSVHAGGNINGGVYYVERGQGVLNAGDSVITNSTRATVTLNNLLALAGATPASVTWMPTTLFLGDGSFDVSAGGSVLLGPVANPFLLPQNLGNSFYEKTYFSTYQPTDAVTVSALAGTLGIEDNDVTNEGSLFGWYADVLEQVGGSPGAYVLSEPWLSIDETSLFPFATAAALLPPTLEATAFHGDINLVGNITLSPAAQGTLILNASGSINGVQNNGIANPAAVPSSSNLYQFGYSTIDLSDANPASLPGVATPTSLPSVAVGTSGGIWSGNTGAYAAIFSNFDALFAVNGATDNVLQVQQALHAPGLLHGDDSDPIYLYADSGNISGLTLYSGKAAQVVAGEDVTDISFYIQNDDADAITLVEAGRDIIPFDASSILREDAQLPGNELFGEFGGILPVAGANATIGAPTNGDIQVAGPGTLEVLAGRNLNLGIGPNNGNGTGVGITSIGDSSNPYLSSTESGANIFAGAGMAPTTGLANDPTQLDYAAFISQFLNPGSAGALADRYLPDLGSVLGLPASDTTDSIWAAFNLLSPAQQQIAALDIFYLVLRDAGRDHNSSSEPAAAAYTNGFDAIAALFPTSALVQRQGDITLTAREIKTTNGGDINLFAPAGALNVGLNVAGTQAVDQGILTVDGGNINIFTNGDVNVGTSRIFTLHGGNEIIWSSYGDIAAGASSKTVQSAPPTRVVVNPQSADVETDLAGLATGGGIGVLETIVGAPPADVDLIAPHGTVNAGDAGIRVSGNLNIAAVQVVNSSNISVGGKSSGTPQAISTNVAGLSAASSAAGATQNIANQQNQQNQNRGQQTSEDIPSLITVEVLGYGGD